MAGFAIGRNRLAYEHEIFTELVVLTQLSPINLDPILASKANLPGAGRRRRTNTMGWG
jgi:hypothetical protein